MRVEWLAVFAAFLGGGVGGRILFFRPERDRMVVDASNAASSAAIVAVNASLERLQGDLEAAYKRIDRLQLANDDLHRQISDLRRQQEQCGDCPWKGIER